MKICSKCKIEKELSEFYNNQATIDGKNYYCKECSKKCNHNWNKENIDYQKRYRELNKGIKIKSKKEKLKETRLFRELEYKNKLREKRKKYLNYQREYANNRRQIDINFKLSGYMRSSISMRLKKINCANHETTEKLLGCNYDVLRSHLEYLFLPGMTWDNYGRGEGKWSIDHIKPCAFFNLIDPEQQKLCFHYTNLQPMWSVENSSKHSFYEGKRYKYKKS